MATASSLHDGVHLPPQQADDVDLEAVRDCAASLGHVGDAPSSCRTAHLIRSLTCLGNENVHARKPVAEPYRLAPGVVGGVAQSGGKRIDYRGEDERVDRKRSCVPRIGRLA